MRSVARLMLFVSALAVSRPAHAGDAATPAQAAFEEGRQLLTAGDYRAAIARFEESERLAPAVGTALNLGSCYEHEGRLASAWRAFRRGADGADASGESRRALRARERAEALAPRLSSLVLVLEGDAAEGLQVRLDETPIDPRAWAVAQPVDGGEHELRVVAAGRRPWSMNVAIAREGEHAKVVVPALVLMEGPEPPAAPPAPLPQEHAPVLRSSTIFWSPTRITGAMAVGAGVVALGIGTYFGLTAISQWNGRQAACPGDFCTDTGYTLTEKAKQSSTASTVAFVISGVSLASGVALFVVASQGKADGMRLAAVPVAGGAGLRLAGSF